MKMLSIVSQVFLQLLKSYLTRFHSHEEVNSRSTRVHALWSNKQKHKTSTQDTSLRLREEKLDPTEYYSESLIIRALQFSIKYFLRKFIIRSCYMRAGAQKFPAHGHIWCVVYSQSRRGSL